RTAMGRAMDAGRRMAVGAPPPPLAAGTGRRPWPLRRPGRSRHRRAQQPPRLVAGTGSSLEDHSRVRACSRPPLFPAAHRIDPFRLPWPFTARPPLRTCAMTPSRLLLALLATVLALPSHAVAAAAAQHRAWVDPLL